MVDPTRCQWRRSTSSYQISIASGTCLGIGIERRYFGEASEALDRVRAPLREMLAAVNLGMLRLDCLEQIESGFAGQPASAGFSAD